MRARGPEREGKRKEKNGALAEIYAVARDGCWHRRDAVVGWKAVCGRFESRVYTYNPCRMIFIFGECVTAADAFQFGPRIAPVISRCLTTQSRNNVDKCTGGSWFIPRVFTINIAGFFSAWCIHTYIRTCDARLMRIAEDRGYITSARTCAFGCYCELIIFGLYERRRNDSFVYRAFMVISAFCARATC